MDRSSLVARATRLTDYKTTHPLPLEIRYLKHTNIDRTRWDAAIEADPEGLPYGFSWWLDAVTGKRWDGLILDNYRVVFPLPLRRSFGSLKQVQRAAFTQQGGPFGLLQPRDASTLFSAIPPTVLSFEMPLVSSVATQEIPQNFSHRQRTNLTLDLSPAYPSLLASFSKTLRKKLRRYPAPQLSTASITTILEVYRGSSGKRSGLKLSHYQQIQNLMEAFSARDMGHFYQLTASEGLLAAGFFPEHRGRIINLFAGSTPLGLQHDGMARLLDAVIQQHQGAGRVFDFEGSDIPGVRDFFRSFGPKNTPYLSVKRKGWLG